MLKKSEVSGNAADILKFSSFFFYSFSRVFIKKCFSKCYPKTSYSNISEFLNQVINFSNSRGKIKLWCVSEIERITKMRKITCEFLWFWAECWDCPCATRQSFGRAARSSCRCAIDRRRRAVVPSPGIETSSASLRIRDSPFLFFFFFLLLFVPKSLATIFFRSHSCFPLTKCARFSLDVNFLSF